MKYVIVSHLFVESARLGSETDDHRSLAGEFVRIISAGFCSLESTPEGIKVHVWGHSQALKVSSREEDAEIIQKTITFRS